MVVTLSDLKLGQHATVVSFDTRSAASRQKLFACGLIPGAQVLVQRIAPLGDPMQIRLDGDILLSIRKSEGRDVKVERSA